MVVVGVAGCGVSRWLKGQQTLESGALRPPTPGERAMVVGMAALLFGVAASALVYGAALMSAGPSSSSVVTDRTSLTTVMLGVAGVLAQSDLLWLLVNGSAWVDQKNVIPF